MIKTEMLYPQFLKSPNGDSSFVVLPIEKFKELIEDYNDLISIAERQNEPSISHSDFLKELKTDGYI